MGASQHPFPQSRKGVEWVAGGGVWAGGAIISLPRALCFYRRMRRRTEALGTLTPSSLPPATASWQSLGWRLVAGWRLKPSSCCATWPLHARGRRRQSFVRPPPGHGHKWTSLLAVAVRRVCDGDALPLGDVLTDVCGTAVVPDSRQPAL